MRASARRFDAALRRLPAGVAPALLTTLAAVLCLAGIGERSLWLDEVFTVNLARLGASEPWAPARDGGSQLLFHWVMKYWIRAGDSEAWIRLPSALAAIGCVPLLFALAARWFGRRVAALACLLLVTSPAYLYFANEARGYAFTLAAVTASWLALGLALERRSPGWWALYAVLSAAAVYCHFFAAFSLAAQVVTLVLFAEGRAAWRRAALALGGVGLLVAPLAMVAASKGSGQVAWIAELELGQIRRTLSFLTGDAGALGAAGYYAAWLGALAWVVRDRRAGRRSATSDGLARALAWLGVPLLCGVALSLVVPIMSYRYFVESLPAAALLAAAVAASLRPPALALAAAVALLGGHAAALGDPPTGAVEDWREATRYVASQASPDDGLVFLAGYTHQPFDYYARREHPGATLPRRLWPPDAEGAGAGGNRAPRDAAAFQAMLGELSAHRRVWVVLSHQKFAGDGRVEGLLERLERSHERAGRRKLRGIRVYRYDARDALRGAPAVGGARREGR